MADVPPTPSASLIKLAELRKDVAQLQQHDAAHTADIADIKEAVVEHSMRLENGIKVFDKHDKRLSTVEAKIAPHPPSILKVVSVTLVIVGMGAGALWGLSNMLRDRPTIEQIDRVIEQHDKNGHADVRDNIREIQKAQALQSQDINQIQEVQHVQTSKIDVLLERIPPRRRHR